MKDERTLASHDGSIIVPRLDEKLWAELHEGTFGKDGVLALKGGVLLYTRPAGKEGQRQWALVTPDKKPSDFQGPFRITRHTWEQISGGSLVEPMKLIVKGDKVHRLVAVVTNKGESAAEAYSPAAHGPGLGQDNKTVLPALNPSLWARMEVGHWHDGGWLAEKEGQVKFLHLAGRRGAEKWVLRAVDTKFGGPRPYPMSREDWNRISCGTLIQPRNIIAKDGRVLRMMAVSVGKQRAAMIYAPVAHQATRQPPDPGPVHAK